MADESLGRLSNFLYRDRAEALGALLVQYAHSRIISAEFGVIWRIWRWSMDHCLLYDSRMVSLNLFEYGKCRIVAVSPGEHDSFRWKWLFEICSDFLVHWPDRWWTNENPTDLELAPFFRGFVDVESGWVSVLCPFSVLFLFCDRDSRPLKQVF